MPMEFTDEMIANRVKQLNLIVKPGESPREVLAKYIEDKYEDFVEGQEIRSGRPWTAFTREDMNSILRKDSTLGLRNPGMMRRLFELDQEEKTKIER